MSALGPGPIQFSLRGVTLRIKPISFLILILVISSAGLLSARTMPNDCVRSCPSCGTKGVEGRLHWPRLRVPPTEVWTDAGFTDLKRYLANGFLAEQPVELVKCPRCSALFWLAEVPGSFIGKGETPPAMVRPLKVFGITRTEKGFSALVDDGSGNPTEVSKGATVGEFKIVDVLQEKVIAYSSKLCVRMTFSNDPEQYQRKMDRFLEWEKENSNPPVPLLLPNEADCYSFMKGKDLPSEKEVYLRREAWWASNAGKRSRKAASPAGKTQKTPQQIENLSRLAALLKPTSCVNHLLRAEVLRELGRFDEAIASLKSLQSCCCHAKEIADAEADPEVLVTRNGNIISMKNKGSSYTKGLFMCDERILKSFAERITELALEGDAEVRTVPPVK